MVGLSKGVNIMKFRTRIFIYAFSITAIIIICLFWVTNQSFSRQHLKNELHRGVQLAKLVALESTDLILMNDRISLLNANQAVVESNPAAAYIFVEHDKEILSHSFERGVPKGLMDLTDFPVHSSFDMTPVEDEQNNLFYHVRVKLDQPSSARIHLGLSAKRIDDQLIPFRRQMFLVGGFLLVIAYQSQL
jgi:hypothetical protein